MERDYHSELRAIIEQLKRLADCAEMTEERAKRTEPLATESIEFSLRAQKKLMLQAGGDID